MIRSLYAAAILCSFILIGLSYNAEEKFISVNTSSTKYVISTSIATNLDHEFSLYCPLLINTKDSLLQFSMSEQKRKMVIEPKCVDDD